MQRPAHEGRLHDAALSEGALEVRDREAGKARPESDVRCGRPLGLQAGEALDRGCRRDGGPLEEQLPCEEGAVQIAVGERARRRHGPKVRRAGG